MTNENGDGKVASDTSEEVTNKTDFTRLFAVRVGLVIRESANRALVAGDNVTQLGNSLAGCTFPRRVAKLLAIDAELSAAISAHWDLLTGYEDARSFIRESAEALTLETERKASAFDKKEKSKP